MRPFVVDFRAVGSIVNLARILGCSEALIRDAAKDKSELCEEHSIPKKNPSRGHRRIVVVTDAALNDALKAFNQRLDSFVRDVLPGFPADCVHGYVKKRSILTNARAHIGAKRLLKTDLEEFFPSLSVARVERVFLTLGITQTIARSLADFLTYEDSLPLGFPSSPLIANLACIDIDRDLLGLATKYGATYTRYSDDLTFSTKGTVLPDVIELREIVARRGFRVAQAKTRYKKAGQAFYVTGLSISDPNRPRAAKAFKRRLRQELYYAKTYGIKQHLGRRDYPSYQAGVNHIYGCLRFLNSIEPHLAQRYRVPFEQACKAEGLEPTFLSRADAATRAVSLFVDESIVSVNGKRCLLLGMVVVEDSDSVRQQMNALRETFLADPFAPGRKAKIKRHGLHWTDLHETQRAQVVEAISSLPLRVFVALAGMPTDEGRPALVQRLLTHLLERRLKTLDGAIVELAIETGTGASSGQLEATTKLCHTKLAQQNAKRPMSISVRVVAKRDEPCLALADIFLGVLSHFLSDAHDNADTTGAISAARSNFERVRTKFRVISDLDADVAYSRRNPL